MSDYFKYPRTYHLPCSMAKTDDDKTHPNYDMFLGKEVVVTLKLDGENTTAYSNGHIHARSLDSKGHESRNWVKAFLPPKLVYLPSGWRVCGENVFAKHSIGYKNLDSYFYLFSAWNDKNICLSWHETKDVAEILDLPLVPKLYIGPFKQSVVESITLDRWRGNESEGFVMRSTSSFHYSEFSDNVGKYVRENHVQTDQHWMHSKIIKNELSPGTF